MGYIFCVTSQCENVRVSKLSSRAERHVVVQFPGGTCCKIVSKPQYSIQYTVYSLVLSPTWHVDTRPPTINCQLIWSTIIAFICLGATIPRFNPQTQTSDLGSFSTQYTALGNFADNYKTSKTWKSYRLFSHCWPYRLQNRCASNLHRWFQKVEITFTRARSCKWHYLSKMLPEVQLSDLQPFGTRKVKPVTTLTCNTFVLAVHTFTTNRRVLRRDIHQVKGHLL